MLTKNAFISGAFLFLFQYSLAQTGPGGVGSAASNVLWLSADNGVYSNTAGTTPAVDGDNVGVWSDRSGNGHHASHGTAGEQPNFETNIINGLPVIRYTAGNGDRLLSTGVATGDAASVWAVAAWASLPSSNPGIIQGAPAGLAFSGSPGDKVIGMWVANAAGNDVWGRGIESDGTNINIPQVTGTSVNTFYSFLNRYDGVSNISQYVNNGLSGSVAYDGTLSSWSDFGIGRQATESWNGDIAEVIAYNISVNSAQRIIIDNYLAAKYNLTLSANDVYTMDNAGNGNFDFEVAGIARVDASNIHSDAKGTGMVRIFNPSNLGNNEYFMWGHDNGDLTTTNTTDVPTGIQGRLSRVWRVIETNAAGTGINVGNLNIQFDLTGQGPVTASDLRLLIDNDGDGVFNEAGTILVAGATAAGSNNYLFTAVAGANITTGDRFTIGTINVTQTPLPIDLESFSGEIVNDDAHLKWTTLSELNNHYFTIKRSLNGKDFISIGEVPGSGTSKIPNAYQYEDRFAPYGRLYYRLEQTDYDETYSYSGIVMLDNHVTGPQIIAVPNPARSGQVITLRIKHTERVDLKKISVAAYDMLGRRVPVTTEPDGQGKLLMRFNNSQKSGIYIISVSSPELFSTLHTRIHNLK